jgi:chorismate synthase
VIDGCPAGLKIDLDFIQEELDRRAPGKDKYRSPRNEADQVEILSGVFEGLSTGAPISLKIANTDAKSASYEPIKGLLRPGHAQYAYLEKYGIFDFRGGGRASARETAARVAAGAIAKVFLQEQGIDLVAYLKQVGAESCSAFSDSSKQLKDALQSSPIFCPDLQVSESICALLEDTMQAGDSIGGVVEFFAEGVPAGLGEPLFDKLPALLAHAMMSLPAAKAFEIGEGMDVATKNGSIHNDTFENRSGKITLSSNHSGGTLGGISTGMPVFGRVAFKPASSIRISQETVSIEGENALFELPVGSRHDPCVAIRAVPVVESMLALVLADALLMNRVSKK